MKTALSLITVPYAISFFGGMFDWYFEDGFYILMGISIIVGIVWAWRLEMKR